MTSKNIEELQAKFQSILKNKTEEELIKEDEYALMANYLSEIERLKLEMGFTRKELAKQINTSGSYLTQVFRGDKPLNFYTLAKLQRALKIRFDVKALPLDGLSYRVKPQMPSIPENSAYKLSASKGVTLTVIPGKLYDVPHFKDDIIETKTA